MLSTACKERGWRYVLALLLAAVITAGQTGAVTDTHSTGTLGRRDINQSWSVDASPTPAGGGSGRLAFVAEGRGGLDIFLMDADGLNITNLTRSCQDEQGVSWSADGTRIAYSATRKIDDCGVTSAGDVHDIYSMNADGTGVRRLTTDPAGDAAPSWSPDGQHIAFQSNRPDPDSDRFNVYVMDADGGNVKRLTPDGGAFPAWSPDGIRIAFHADHGSVHGNGDIYVVNTDGTDEFNATAGSEGNEEWQSWSPDGMQLAVYSNRADPETDNYEVWIVDVNGGAMRQLTQGAANKDIPCPPAWSPDGSLIAYTTRHGEDLEIHLVRTDGSGDVLLTPGLWSACPAWDPRSAVS